MTAPITEEARAVRFRYRTAGIDEAPISDNGLSSGASGRRQEWVRRGSWPTGISRYTSVTVWT